MKDVWGRGASNIMAALGATMPATTTFGFTWGPVVVERVASIRPRRGRETFIVSINGLEVRVSKTGRSVRVFRDGKELK